jgi:hypothetical protein
MASQPNPLTFQNFPYLRPIAIDVFPLDLRSRLTKELAAFDRARNRFLVCTSRYVFLRAMNTPFFDRIDNSPSRQPFVTVCSTFETSVVIGLVTFFYSSGKNDINLLTIKNSILRDLPAIRKNHKARGIPECDTERLIERLDKTCRRAGKGVIQERFKRLGVWRDREYAHIDVSPIRGEARPSLHDIGICFVITAKIFRYIFCLLVPSSEDVLATRMQRLLRRQAQRFVDSVRPLPSPRNTWVWLYHKRPPATGWGWSFTYNHIPPELAQPYAPVGPTRGWNVTFQHDADPSRPTTFVRDGIRFYLHPDYFFQFFPLFLRPLRPTKT